MCYYLLSEAQAPVPLTLFPESLPGTFSEGDVQKRNLEFDTMPRQAVTCFEGFGVLHFS
jgi:hypothetical protein